MRHGSMQARKEEQLDAPIQPGSDGHHWHQGRHDHRQEQPENSDQELRGLEVTTNGYRQSATCDDSDDEDAFDPDEAMADEHLQGTEHPHDSGDTEQRRAIPVCKAQSSPMIAASRHKDGQYVTALEENHVHKGQQIQRLYLRLRSERLGHSFTNVRGEGCNGVTVYLHICKVMYAWHVSMLYNA